MVEKSLNYNFKRSCIWGRKDKNRDTAGLNFKRQWCHWINMSAAHFKVKTRRRCFYVNVSLNRLASEKLKQCIWARWSFTAVNVPEKPLFAPKAPPCGREWICIYSVILCSDRCEYWLMFLCSKHSCKCWKKLMCLLKIETIKTVIYVLN